MTASSRGTKILIAVLGALVVLLSIALFVVTRSPKEAVEDRPLAAAPPPDRQQGGFARAASGPGAQPPARARNELGQPLNEDGRPMGPPEKLERTRTRPIAPGEVPLTPPLFTDAAQRATFKRWWVDELGRRIAIYQTLEPRAHYPSAQDTHDMLDALYDAAEPRGPGESVEQAYQRRQAWQSLWKQFLDTYGATLHTAVSRGGDPQYGDTPAPPVQPPGADRTDVPPAQPATDSPPGRGPAGTEESTPVRQEGDVRASGN